MSVNIDQFLRVTNAFEAVERLLAKYPNQADLVAIRDDLIAQARALRPVS